MRVIAGKAGGRKLQTPSDEAIRPTTERVKEALFNIIQFEIEGRMVLDLFAGTGQLGIEALSRGAERAVFVERDPKAAALVRQNLAHCGLEKQAVVLQQDSLQFLRGWNDVFDLAFLDPAYGTGTLQAALPETAKLMRKSGVMVCESPLNEDVPETAGEFQLVSSRKYGKIKLSIFRGVKL